MVKACHHTVEVVVVGATGAGVDSLSPTDAANFRYRVQQLFYELSNEWLNEEVEGYSLWHTFYEDEDLEPLSDEIIGCVITNICSDRNIPIALLYQCLQVCFDYLRVTDTRGYFVEIGSFALGKSQTPVWYRRLREDQPSRFARFFRQQLSRFCGDISEKNLSRSPIPYCPDVRPGAGMEILRQQMEGKTPVEVIVETLYEQGTERELERVAQLFIGYISPEQPVLDGFVGVGANKWTITRSENEKKQQVGRLHIRGYLPDFNPIFAGIATRGAIESCHLAGVANPLKISVELESYR
ncbi:hypothetical protein ACTOVN_07420 [Arcanobacterium canis]